MTHSLNGKTALVTGATSGMGRAAALALVKTGANVVATGRSPEGLASLPASGQLIAMRGDVTDPADVHALVERAVSHYGALDVVFNVAGIAQEGSFLDDLDIWQRTMDINFNGVVNVCRAAIPKLRAAGGGSIVNWASTTICRRGRP